MIKLLQKYVNLLHNHLMDVLPTAISLLDNLSAAHFSHISNILSHDVIGLLVLYFKLIFVIILYFLNIGFVFFYLQF